MKHLRRAAVIAAMWTLTLLPGAAAEQQLPGALTTSAPVQFVNCGGGCCCGDVTVIYRGAYYGNPAYCLWWRPGRTWPTLRDGQTVTATVWLWR